MNGYPVLRKRNVTLATTTNALIVMTVKIAQYVGGIHSYL